MQTHAGLVLAAPVSVSSREPCSIDLDDLDLLVSSIRLSYFFCLLFSVGFSELWGRGLVSSYSFKSSRNLCMVFLRQ